MTVRQGMKFTEVSEANAKGLIEDDSVVFEQKMDGTRVLAVITPGNVKFLQSGGQVLTHSAAVQHLGPLRETLGKLLGDTPGELVLDGELLIRTGELYLFDAPYARFGGLRVIGPDDTFAVRRRVLETPEIRVNMLDSPVKVVQQAWSWREKRALMEDLRDAGAEGLIAKDLGGTYEPGKRVKHTQKIKFVKSADVIVMAVDRPDPKHGSITFGVVGSGPTAVDFNEMLGLPFRSRISVQYLGKCSAIGKPEVKVGDVIEVAYLYREPGSGGLVQPRMMQVRHDKPPAQCTLDQFPTYSRDVVNVRNR